MTGIMSSLFERRAYAPDDDYWYEPVSLPSASGVSVTPQTALQGTAVWAAVSVISGSVGTLPLKLYRRRADGGKEQATDHPLYDKLARRPNPWQTSSAFKEMMQGHVLLRGNAYAQIVRRGSRIEYILPLHPNRITVEVDGADIWYIYNGGGRPVTYKNEKGMLPEILHLAGLTADGITGYSPITLMREAVGLSLATEKYGARFFGNDASPSGILTHPGKLTSEARRNLKASWQEAHAQGNQHKIAVLEHGLTWTQVGLTSEDAQFLQTRTFQVNEVARMFNIPPHKIREMSKSTFSNISHQAIEYVQDTLMPWVVRWEEKLELSLLTATEREEYFIKFNVAALLRGDEESRGKFYNAQFNVGALSINEIRDSEDRNPVEGGDTHFVPLNMVPLEQATEPPPEPTPPPEPPDDEENALTRPIERRSIATRFKQERAYRRLFTTTADRLINRELVDLRRLDKLLAKEGVEAWRAKLKSMYRGVPEVVHRFMHPVYQSYAETIGSIAAWEVKADVPDLEETARSISLSAAERHSRVSYNQLDKLAREAADIEEAQALLEERYEKWEDGRAQRIGLRESVTTGSAFAAATWALAGTTALIWVTSTDPCNLCQELDGRQIKAGETFVKRGEDVDPKDGQTTPLTAPNDIPYPQLHDGCECGIAPG